MSDVNFEGEKKFISRSKTGAKLKQGDRIKGLGIILVRCMTRLGLALLWHDRNELCNSVRQSQADV